MSESLSLTIDEKVQAIREAWLNLEATTDPATMRRFFTSNVMQRTLAQLIARGETSAVPLVCTEGGRLKVVSLPGGFTHNDVTYDATVADAYTEFVFADICGRVDIWVWDNGATIKRRATSVSGYEDEIKIDANQFYSFDCDVDAISYKNTTGAAVAKLQAVGWY